MSTTSHSQALDDGADGASVAPANTLARSAPLGTQLAQTVLPAAFIATVFIAWELWVRLASLPDYLLPSPSEIVGVLASNWTSTLARDTWVTLSEALIGFTGGCLFGFTLAIAITYSKILERTIYPLIVASQATPKIALAPLFVVWLGFGIAPKIMVTILLVFFPIVVTTAQGLKSVDPSLLELLRSVSATKWQIFRKVRLPHALPYIASGMKIAITLALIGAVVGEWVGANEGLGYRIIYAKSQLQTPLTFAAIAILVVVGVILFTLVSLLGRAMTPWKEEDQPMVGGM